MFAYLERSGVGQKLEEKIKFYKSVTYTSHRRVSNTETGKVMLLHNHYSSRMQKVVVWWWNRGGSVNTKETTYVVSVLHIGVHYIDFLMQKGQCLAVS